MTAVLDFIDAAANALTGHATYTWNKAGTRIRCNGDACGTVLEVTEGEDGAVAVFARHQAEQLPEPPILEVQITPATVPEPEGPAQAAEAPADPEAEPAPETSPELTPVSTEPAGEPMESALAETVAEEKAAPKVRRDTKALTATIAEINKGDRVVAGFNHPRYGQFTVEGTVIKGGAGLDRNQLMVGGWYINLNERAAKHLHELAIIAPAGSHEFAIPKPSEANEHVGIGG
ncbi:MAG TPA: hypothetical protein VF885_13150 [Arthrobacter sp.]